MASTFICEESPRPLADAQPTDAVIIECRGPGCPNTFSYVRGSSSGRFPRFCSPECKLRRQRSQVSAWQREHRDRFRRLCKKSYDKLHKGDLGKVARAAKYASDLGKSFICKHCGETFRSRQANAVYCSVEHMAAALSALNTTTPLLTCAKPECGKLFKPSRRNRQQRASGYVQKHCSYQCAGLKPPRKRKPNRKQRRKELRAGGYWHPVNPIKVFERDGWKCHLCGIKTPKRLRGTYDDRAPELDHIVSLAAGGDHTYANTACACRLCNQEKGAKPLGQLLLFG